MAHCSLKYVAWLQVKNGNSRLLLHRWSHSLNTARSYRFSSINSALSNCQHEAVNPTHTSYYDKKKSVFGAFIGLRESSSVASTVSAGAVLSTANSDMVTMMYFFISC